MFVTDAEAFVRALDTLPTTPAGAAIARAAFLVAPAADHLARESARDNRYMRLQHGFDLARARAQHAALLQALAAELPVWSFPGDPACADGMFPNNVFATVPGRLLVGRMRHPQRRREAARQDIRRFFSDLLGYAETDLSTQPQLVAELTGSLVIDRARGIGYCGLSERCNEAGARAMHAAFGLRLTYAFPLATGEYHTNVVLALAGGAALMAADGFAETATVAAIARAHEGRVLWLQPEHKRAYAGNAISLAPGRLWMSAAAAAALTTAQNQQLASWGLRVASVALDEIEKAGGSLRCCVAEVF